MIKPKKPTPTCSAANWDLVIGAANSQKDSVTVSRKVLDDICACHARFSDTPEAKALPSARLMRARYTIPREDLFAFVQKHGEVCGKEQE